MILRDGRRVVHDMGPSVRTDADAIEARDHLKARGLLAILTGEFHSRDYASDSAHINMQKLQEPKLNRHKNS